MKLGTETGSLVNHLMGNNNAESTIGMGCTVLYWTDRKAATIVKVTKMTITCRLDKSTRVDKNGMSDQQVYTYESDPEGSLMVFRKTKKGWKGQGASLSLGHRSTYHDYSF